MGKIISDERASFSVISNHHLWRKDLSFRAKGLLDFILASPPDWKISEAGLMAYSGGEGKTAIRTAMKELIDKGYITRHQTRDESGRLGEMEYQIYQRPEEEEKETSREKNSAKHYRSQPLFHNPPTDKPELDEPSMDNQPLLNIIDTKHLYTKCSNTKDRLIDNARARESEGVGQCGKVENSEIQRLYYHRVVTNNIGYDALQSEFRDSRAELDELVELMVDVLTADPGSTTYIAGQEMRISVVQSRFMKLQQVHLEQLLLNLGTTTKRVRNMRSYLLTCLYQSFVTAHNEIRQQVNAANFA